MMTDLVDLPNTEDALDRNEDSYDDLIVSIEASENRLSLLIAVCDDPQYRDQIIDRYETELQPETRPYRVTLDRKEPSLRAAIAQLIQSEDYLQKNSKAIITVTGTEELYFLRLGEERSEQEIFFGYLQWTREALREFHYPIILWVNKQLKNNIIKKAPDFWSWRKGVFPFAPIDSISNTFYVGVDNDGVPTTYYNSSKGKIALIKWKSKNFWSANRTPQEHSIQVSNSFQEKVKEPYKKSRIFVLPRNQENNSQSKQKNLDLKDLLEIIRQVENDKGEKNVENKLILVVLYESVGQIYQKKIEKGKIENHKTEQDVAIKYFKQAITLRRELNLRNGLDISLANLGSLYEAKGEYEQAKQLYSEALDILQEQGNYADAIARLNDLARILHAQGEYEEALKLYQQALEIYEDGKDTDIATYARTINLLAGTYHAQGKYAEAERSYKQSLDIRLKEFGESHSDVAVSLNNLGLLYTEQGKFSDAESNYQKALAIQKKLFGDTNLDIATSLNNIALLYYAQIRLTEAEPYLENALKIRKQLLGDRHPDVAGSLNNLAGLYKAQGRFAEAEPLYENALAIAITTLGDEHPITQKFKDNIHKLGEQLSLSKEP